MMQATRVRVLGPLEWYIDGRSVALGGTKQKTVLASLLVSTDHRASIGWLVDAVWPEQPPSTAAKQIRNAISELRAIVAPSAATILTVPQGYQLDLPQDSLDLRDFERTVARGRARLAADNAAEAADHLRAALAMWSGAALSNLDSAGVRALAAGLDDERLFVCEQLVDIEIGLGREREVLRDLTRMVAANPLHEGLAARLMSVLDRAGMRHRALAVYLDTRTALVRELGLEPGIELRQVHRGILAGGTSGPVDVRPTPDGHYPQRFAAG